jgi:glycerophosphoryl diester phosphodiesterase
MLSRSGKQSKQTQRDNKHHRGQKTRTSAIFAGCCINGRSSLRWLRLEATPATQGVIIAEAVMKIELGHFPFFTGEKPRVFGHRGAAGTVPENTLLSFERALADGAGYIELDVHETRDGEIAIIHDDSVDRTTDGRGRVCEMDIDALRRLDAGYRFTTDGGRSYPYRGQGIRIPTLTDFFQCYPGVPTVIEVKLLSVEGIGNLLDQIARAGKVSEVLLAGYEDEVMTAVRQAIAAQGVEIATSYSFGEMEALMNWLWKGCHGEPPVRGQALQIPCEYEGLSLITEETVSVAHSMGLEVHAWTINEVADMQRLLDLGVDGIVTDFPARMREVKKNR